MSTEPWFLRFRPLPGARFRLYCVAWAGASATVFRDWPQARSDDIEVCAVQLPGRGRRVRERPVRKMTPLADALAEAIAEDTDRPYALYGHCMGGAVAYEVARRLCSSGAVAPRHLYVCSRRAPHRPLASTPLHALEEAELLAEASSRFGATFASTPSQVLDHRELMLALLPVIRADMELDETYRRDVESKLACPLTAFGGEADDLIPLEEVEAWRACGSADFSLTTYRGGHFPQGQDLHRIQSIIRSDFVR